MFSDFVEELVCESCGTNEDVRIVDDPFNAEVNNEYNEVTLCGQCYGIRLDDI